MIIEEADFRMESVGDNLHFWDLSILKTIKSKDGERQEFKVIGYGLPISACLQRIADYRIECKHPDAMSLKEYIQDYKHTFAFQNFPLYILLQRCTKGT